MSADHRCRQWLEFKGSVRCEGCGVYLCERCRRPTLWVNRWVCLDTAGCARRQAAAGWEASKLAKLRQAVKGGGTR